MFRASSDGQMVKVWHSHCFSGPGLILGMEPHHPSVSCHAVAAAHIELEQLTARIYNCALGHWGEKEEEDWQQMLAQSESFPAKKKVNDSPVCPFWAVKVFLGAILYLLSLVPLELLC